MASLLEADREADDLFRPLSEIASPDTVKPTHELDETLREALAGKYELLDVLGAGGMGTVYLARDVRHDRKVAVKTLHPGLVTTEVRERFKGEIRIAAPLSHPHILPVHDSGDAAGLLYYVMPFVEGESLKERLRRKGRLPLAESVRIAREVASALSYAHERGVVHRDIKPGNILLSAGEAVVADFGIAKALGDAGTEQTTQTGTAVGSPAYMSPEQSQGESDLDGRTDIYSLSCVLYEMLVGEPPFTGATPLATIAQSLHEPPPPLGSRVRGIPSHIEEAVHRALSKSREGRFDTAEEFGRALVLVAVLALAVGWRFIGKPGAETSSPARIDSDIAVVPCTPGIPADSGDASAIARMTALNLQGIPNLTEVPVHTSFRWWNAHHRGASWWIEAASALGARHVLRCSLVRVPPDRYEVRLELLDPQGNVGHASVVAGPAISPPVGLADSLTLVIVGALRPAVVLSDLGYRALSGHHVEAIRALLAGEAAFQRGAWAAAQRHYSDALTIDSSFVLARWRLADIRRWTITATSADLRGLDSASAAQLGQVDRMLLQARLLGHGPHQLQAYEAVVREHPHDAYALLIYGDELFHRGPLWGVSLDSARTVLRQAARIDTFLIPAFDHLVQADIQLGDSASARLALEQLHRLSALPPEVEIYLPALWEQAYLERFEPEAAASRRSDVFPVANSQDRQAVALAARRGLSLGLGATEAALGAILAEAEGSQPSERVTGRVAQGLAAFALGQPGRALALFDSAAAIGDEEEVFQAAQWRVVPAALGLAGVSEAERMAGGRALEIAASDTSGTDSDRAMRALWSLGISELRKGDTLAARRRARRISDLAGTGDYAGLARLLDAALEASAGEYDSALRTSAPLSRYDALDRLEQPFARSAVHLLRSDWFERSGDLAAASRELVWHENEDLEGLPAGAAQAAEVDWVFAAFARLRQARIALAMDNTEDACRHAAEVVRIWSRPEPALETLAREAGQLRDEACQA
jgi:serine/threonine protein kinase/tetratricopeptide (TPR) repeat protein